MQRTAYRGSDVFLQLVDGSEAPWSGGVKRLHARALVTNRHLPLLMPRPVGESHFTIETGAPIAAIACLGEPSPPRPSLAHGEPARARPNQPFGETAWRLISQLSLNYLSLVDDEDGRGAGALREMLRLYADFALPAHAKQIEGLRAVASHPVIDRLHGAGPITFGRGLEVRLTFEESYFDGGSAFLMGSVLEQFFRRYVSINAFTRTVIATLERGEIMQWPTRTGRRHLL
jgi:type VI secretion system protein ImpG